MGLAISMLCAVCAAGFDARAEDSHAPQAIEIRIHPSTVYAGIRYRVSATSGESILDAPDASIAWKSASGAFLFDDLPEVEWRAPRTPGRATLEVSVTRGGVETRAALEVMVRRPSTEGMAWIPAGTFLRGDIRGTQDVTEGKTLQNSSDEPAHPVYLDGYWMDRHFVTNSLYAAFLDEMLKQGMARVEPIAVMGEFEGSWVPFYYFQSFEKLIRGYHDHRNARKPEFLHVISHDEEGFHVEAGRADYPAVDVSWFGAAAYARFHGKDLPTEAQWEKAARGVDGRRYPWGNQVPTPYHANVNFHYGMELTPVGSFSPLGDSPYGVADMAASCFEWSRDWYNPTYFEDYLAPDLPLGNPTGPFWGRAHAIRGSPHEVSFPQAPGEHPEPVSFRYSWRFEFGLGDTFGNRSTGFRTVLEDADGP